MNKVSKSMKFKNENKYSVKDVKSFKFIMLIGILLVIFYTPFLRGLYFEPEQLITQIILFSMFILFWINKWLKKDKSFLKTPIEYAALGLVGVYFISSFTAASQRLAVSELLKYAMLFVVFFMLSDLIKTEKEKSIVLWTIVSSALGLSIIGIDSAAGNTFVNVLNSIFKALHLNFELFGLFVEGRIHSTMQYPNAFASYLMAVFFVSTSLSMNSSKWIKSLLSAINFVLLTTFIFTVSRGAYVLFLLEIIVFIALLPKESKFKGLYNILTTGIITAGFALILSRFIFDELANKMLIWPIVLAGAVFSFLIRTTDDWAINILKKVNWKIAAVGFFALVSISVLVTGYIFNASVPLELGHTMEEDDGTIGVSKRVILNSGKYRLVFDVDGNSINEKASFVYSVNIKSKIKSGTETGNEVDIINEKYSSTDGKEKKQIEFTVSGDSEYVSILFQNYYSGTRAKIFNAKIYDADNGKSVKNLVLKHKYSFAGSILSRFENIMFDNSFITRITFLKDGFKIFKDWWLIGSGGGGWSILNFKYQSYLYWSTQTHNYPLQVVIETGLIGLITLVLLLFSIVKSFVNLNKKQTQNNINGKVTNVAIFTSVIFLFLHAVMDFDFSLLSIYLTFWILIALLNAEERNILQSVGREAKKKNKNLNFKDKLRNMYKRGFNVYPPVVIVLTIAILIYPIIFYRAHIYANKALYRYRENEIDEAINLMEKATTLDYLNTEYVTGYTPIASRPDVRLGYIDLVVEKMGISKNQNEDRTLLSNYVAKAQKLADKVEKQAKYNSNLSLNLGIYYLNTSDKEKGIDFINKSVDLKPLVPSQWHYKVNANYATAINYLQQRENKKGIEYINNTLKTIEEAQIINKSNLFPFVFNSTTHEFLEKAYFIKNSAEKNLMNLENLVFQSIFEMDVNNDNIPDQWFINNKSAVESDSKNGIFNVKMADLSKEPYIYTRSLHFEAKEEYRVEVELSNTRDIESIPFLITGVTDKTEQLYFNNNVYSAKIITPAKIDSGNSKLVLYIIGNYEIKNVRIIKE